MTSMVKAEQVCISTNSFLKSPRGNAEITWSRCSGV